MSDLAPFVAATLRDKVVSEMEEEIKQLREKVRKLKTVSITGPLGTPVYAEVQFDQDGRTANNPNLWEVDFSEANNRASCPLARLKEVEIRIGGICKARFSQYSTYEGWLEEGLFRVENGLVEGINFCFSAGSGALWLMIRFGTITSDDESRLEELYDIAPEFLIDSLVEQFAEQPNVTVSFDHIAFFNSEVNGLMDILGLDYQRTGM